MRASTRLVWAIYGAVAVAMLVTYTRVPVRALYHVSHGGIGGGLSRVLVLSNFSTALVAPIALALAADRLASRRADALAWLSLALCAVVAWPGVVDQADLDAKPVNAVPALGVALAVALSLAAGGGRLPVGRARAALIGLLAFLSVPWIAAEAGFHVGLGLFLAGSRYEGHAAVHLGHHHGLDGVLLASAALLLWSAPATVARPRLARALRAYLALLLAYGLVNAANDAWTEQVVKRGWTSWSIPDALHPRLAWPWLVIVLGAAALVIIDAWRMRRAWSSSGSASTSGPTGSTPSSPSPATSGAEDGGHASGSRASPSP